MLNNELGVPLALSARAADRILTGGVAPNRIQIAATADRSMTLHLDLTRFLSTSNASLAAAFAFASPRGPGRPRLPAPKNPQVDEFFPVWKIRIDDEPEKLARLAQQLREWEAYPRGIERGLPFIMDAATLKAVPRLALSTTRGEIDIVLVGGA